MSIFFSFRDPDALPHEHESTSPRFLSKKGHRGEKSEMDTSVSSGSVSGSSMQESDDDQPPLAVAFTLKRMLPPGKCQYYFLVYGDGKLLLRHNGTDLEPCSPHRTSIEKGYLGTHVGEIPNYATLTRPDQYTSNPTILEKTPAAGRRVGRNCELGMGNDAQTLASLSFASISLTEAQPNCGIVKVDPTTEFFAILDEERTKKFHTLNIDDTAEEDDNEDDFVEEIEEWHPRVENSIFAARRFETGGSFLDEKYDIGPERTKTVGSEQSNFF